MARVSEKEVSQGIENKISSQLISHVASIKTKEDSEKFLDELLGDDERLMLAKRLAVVVMLERDYSYQTIKKTLRVSTDTIARLSKEKDKGRFSFIESHCGTRSVKKMSDDDFWDFLEKVLQAGMPPIGKGRWKFLDDIYGKPPYRN